MANLFGIDIQGLVNTALGSQLFDSTLTKTTSSGAYNSSDPSAGSSPTTVAYSCKGIATKVIHMFMDKDQRRRLDGEVMVLLGSMSTKGVCPAPGDTITTVDPRTKLTVTGVVQKVSVDPASAQATCKVAA